MSDKTINPCPFCGGQPLFCRTMRNGYAEYHYACHNDNCRVQPVSVRSANVLDALRDWNSKKA